MPLKVTKRIQEEYETLLRDVGEDRFFSHVFGNGVSARRHYEFPEITMLEQSDAFFSLFRTTGDANYFTIGKILRRCSHKLYREGRRKNPEYPINKRFLALVGK
jgi:hypothetical protein